MSWNYYDHVLRPDHAQREVEERKRQHLERVYASQHPPYEVCMHDSCAQCCGTGVKHDGSACVHMISCPCSKCSPRCM